MAKLINTIFQAVRFIEGYYNLENSIKIYIKEAQFIEYSTVQYFGLLRNRVDCTINYQFTLNLSCVMSVSALYELAF